MSCFCCPLLRRSSDTPRSQSDESFTPRTPRAITIEGKAPFEFLIAHATETDQTLWRRSASFSPRIPQGNLSQMVLRMQDYLLERMDCPRQTLTILSQVLGQIYYNQYEPLCPDGYELVASLYASELLEPCLIAIYHLTLPGNSCIQILSPSLLKMGLKIIEYPYTLSQCNEQLIEPAVDHILAASGRMKREESQRLMQTARKVWEVRKEKRPSPLMLAREGLSLLERCMHDAEDQWAFYSLQQREQRASGEEKLFLFALKRFFLENPNRLRLNNLQEALLLQNGLNLLLSKESAPLLKDPRIRSIGQEIIQTISWEEELATQRAQQRASQLVRTPFLSLKGLELLLLWTQQPFSDLDVARDILAGTREWDPEGEIYQFAMEQFIEFSKMPWDHQTILYQLLRFLYCARSAPANYDLFSVPFIQSRWRKCLTFAQSALNPEIYAKLRKEFEGALRLEFPPVVSPSLPEVNPEEPVACALWEGKAGMKRLRDSVLVYLLSARQQITVFDLAVHPKMQSIAILEQEKRFNQVVQFFTDQLLKINQTSNKLRSMIKRLSTIQEYFLKTSAFEAALAIHMVFQQGAVSRLKHLFSDDPFLSALFEDTQSWCHFSDNFKMLRELQSQSRKAFDVSYLLSSDLIHLRENPYEFREMGGLNLDRLECFGKLYNRFALRKEQALNFWAANISLQPEFSLIEAFKAQSGCIDDEELQEEWWGLSHTIMLNRRAST